MALREEMENTGEWLFRWRSYIPLVLLGVLVLALRDFSYFGGSHGWDIAWDIFCIGVAFAGLAVRATAVGCAPARTSGRNTHGQVAGTLNTTGMYSIVRHPLYLGNYLMWLGIALFPHNMWVPVVVSLLFFLYYERIMLAEERFLRQEFGAAFEAWAARTPAFIPRFAQWVRPSLPFSLRHVLKREYSGFFAIVAIMFALEVAFEWRIAGLIDFEPGWVAFFAVSLAIYLVLRSLKKHTRLLHIEGR